MASLESILKITAIDDVSPTLAKIKKEIADLEKTVSGMDKLVSTVNAVSRAAEPLARSLTEASRAMASQRNELSSIVSMLDRVVGPTEKAAAAQRSLARSVEAATSAFSRQSSAARSAERAAGGGGGGGGRAGGGHGGHGVLGGVAPFLGPVVEEGAKKYFEAGGTVEEEIARLKAMGASQADIDKARGGWRGMSKNYAGISENEYLAGYRSARTVAPGEAFEMADLGAKYRLALRNSGLAASDTDVEDIQKIMDEQGLKTPAQRDSFVNEMLKTQQTFGNQISPETMLSAYRNAKQSMYGWSDKFKNSYFPTILQASGQQGGTEMMTAYNNWIGGHLSHAELKAMAAAGFVDNNDLLTNKVGDIKGLKPGAHMYNPDQFKSDIASWSWGFHDTFIKRKGATEGKFDDLIATMPRNMAALVAFLVHNEDRIKRDAATREGAVGSLAAGNNFLGVNPAAGLEALGTSLNSLLGVVSQPSMKTAAAGLEATAAALSKLSALYGDFAQKNPALAKDIGIGAGAGAAGLGGWLSLKGLLGLGGYFGIGPGAGAADAGAAALGPLAGLAGIFYELGAPNSGLRVFMDKLMKNQQPYQISDNWGVVGDWRTRTSYAHQSDMHPIIRGERDMEGARAGALSHLLEGGHTSAGAPPQDVAVHGEANISGVIRVEAGSELLRVVNEALSISKQVALNPTQGGHGGRMDSDAAPIGHGGVGHM